MKQQSALMCLAFSWNMGYKAIRGGFGSELAWFGAVCVLSVLDLPICFTSVLLSSF